jgi:hypothetical protein
MNRQAKYPRLVKVLLSVMAAAAMCSAHAQKGVLEIHGVLVSPGCQLSLQALQRLSGQTQVSGQACGLTSGAGNALSQVAIAQVAEETTVSPQGEGSPKRLMTLSYR